MAQYGGDSRLAVVTGASSGIGDAACRLLREHGWRVVGLSRRRAPHADLSLRVDVGVGHEVSEALAGVGTADLVLHAAGAIEPVAPVAEVDPAEWEASLRTNLLGTFHVLRYALPPMLAAGRGVIVHVSSGAASRVEPWWSAYCATKAGTEHLVRVAAAEADGRGVAICAVNPGLTETPMQTTIRATEFPGNPRFVVAHQEGTSRTADDAAAAMIALADRDPRDINGQVLVL